MKIQTTAGLVATILFLTLAGVQSGCGTHGKYTQEGKDLAQSRMSQLKAGVQLQMAQQQFLASDLEKARKSIEVALNAVPNYPQAHVLRGRILMELGDLENARQCFLIAESIDPNMPDSQYYAGICYERFRQWEPAFERYSRAADLDRANPQYVVAAAEMLVHQKQNDQALALLTERRKDFAHNAAIVQCLGNLATLAGDNELAVSHLQDARMLAPDDLTILESLARAQVAAGKFADAEFSVSKLLDAQAAEQPKFSSNLKARVASQTPISRRDLQLLRARCLVGLQRFSEARQILVEQTASAEGQKDVSTWIQLGHVASKLDDAVRIRQVAAKLLSIAPDRHEGHTFRAIALALQADYPAAEQAAIKAVELAARSGQADAGPLLVLSNIQIKAGKTVEALASARAAISIDPESATAQRLVDSLSTTASVPAE